MMMDQSPSALKQRPCILVLLLKVGSYIQLAATIWLGKTNMKTCYKIFREKTWYISAQCLLCTNYHRIHGDLQNSSEVY